MSTLRLGAYKLPAAEVVLVQTLFHLYSHGDNFRWIFVTAPPYDALLVDSAIDIAQDPETTRLVKAVLRLTHTNSSAAPNTLQRPIRADHLFAWLKATEHELLETRPVSRIMSALSASPASALIHAAAELHTPAIASMRFQLRRWPPASLLRNDPKLIRMSTLLSRRALNAAELAGLSQQPLIDCQAFLQTLQTTGLVEIQQQAPDPAARPAEQPTAATPTLPANARRGLISGIRRRLGL